MNRTLEIEQAYYKALGIEAQYCVYEPTGYEYLDDSEGNTLPRLLNDDDKCYNLMNRHKINVHFLEQCVYTTHFESAELFEVYYSPEHSDLWTLNAAIVIAATDKLERAK